MKIAIFDFEGTLVDFQWQLAAAMAEVYPVIDECVSLCNLDREFIRQADYCRLYNYLQQQIPDSELRRQTIAEIDEIFDFFDADAASRWELYPEIPGLMSNLKKAGWGLSLASNVGRDALNLMLDKFSLTNYFDLTISRNEVELLKPEVEGLNLIKSFYRDGSATVTEAWMVGDSVTDIETARKAGIKAAVRVNGEDRTERLKAHKPDYLVDNLSELEAIFLSR